MGGGGEREGGGREGGENRHVREGGIGKWGGGGGGGGVKREYSQPHSQALSLSLLAHTQI